MNMVGNMFNRALDHNNIIEHNLSHARYANGHNHVILNKRCADSADPDQEVRQGQKVINEMITCLYKPNGDQRRSDRVKRS